MFDPTIFENLKVVIEGAVYDLDAVGVILVTNRVDRVDLATMSRYYAIQFYEREREDNGASAEIRLFADTEDLMDEILDKVDKFTGCRVEIAFYLSMDDPAQQCSQIEGVLGGIWESRPQIEQKLSFVYGDEPRRYENHIRLDFGRKINEDQIEDMGSMIDLVLHSLQRLNQLQVKEEGND